MKKQWEFVWFQNAVFRGRCRNRIGTSKWKFESEFSTSRSTSQKSSRTSGHPKVKMLHGPLDTLKNSNRTSGHQKFKSATQHPDNEKFKFDTDLWTPPSSALKKTVQKAWEFVVVSNATNNRLLNDHRSQTKTIKIHWKFSGILIAFTALGFYSMFCWYS